MVNATTIIGATGSVVTALDLAGKGWTHWDRRKHGQPSITSHNHNPTAQPGWVQIGGLFVPSKGFLWMKPDSVSTFWMVTRLGNQHWPQFQLGPRADGTWASRINVNNMPGPRQVTVLLVWASRFMDQIFQDYKKRGNATKHWDGILMNPPKCEMKIVQGFELQVVGESPKTGNA